MIFKQSTSKAWATPRRDVDAYFRQAQAQGTPDPLRRRHAPAQDYLAGICELPARSDVQLLASARAELRHPVRRLGDGARLEMGEVVFEVMVPRGRPVAVVCGSGYRSSVAASLLKRHGQRDVANVLGGMAGWVNAGFETTGISARCLRANGACHRFS